jgi:hypothetical protein
MMIWLVVNGPCVVFLLFSHADLTRSTKTRGDECPLSIIGRCIVSSQVD